MHNLIHHIGAIKIDGANWVREHSSKCNDIVIRRQRFAMFDTNADERIIADPKESTPNACSFRL